MRIVAGYWKSSRFTRPLGGYWEAGKLILGCENAAVNGNLAVVVKD